MTDALTAPDASCMFKVVGRPLVRLYGFQPDILQQDVLGMADGESPCRLDAMSRRFGIVSFAPLSLLTCLGNEEGVAATLLTEVLHRQSTTVQHIEILDADIADGVPLHTGYQTGIAAVGIGDVDITDANAADA